MARLKIGKGGTIGYLDIKTRENNAVIGRAPVVATPDQQKKMEEHELGHKADFEKVFEDVMRPAIKNMTKYQDKGRAVRVTFGGKDACANLIDRLAGWTAAQNEFLRRFSLINASRDNREHVLGKPVWNESAKNYELRLSW